MEKNNQKNRYENPTLRSISRVREFLKKNNSKFFSLTQLQKILGSHNYTIHTIVGFLIENGEVESVSNGKFTLLKWRVESSNE